MLINTEKFSFQSGFYSKEKENNQDYTAALKPGYVFSYLNKLSYLIYYFQN